MMTESKPKRLSARVSARLVEAEERYGIGRAKQTDKYWKGYDQKADELLARELLLGEIVHHASGRVKVKFLQQDNPRERMAREALARLLTFYTMNNIDAAVNIVYPLCSILTNETNRRIVFGFRKKGNKSSRDADFQLGIHVLNRTHDHGWPVEAAVQDVIDKFKVTRKTVFEAYMRTKKQFQAWGVSVV
jgi:hypothetical protein